MVWEFFNFGILSPIKKMFVKEVVGIENIPKNPPFIVALNHASYLDAFIIWKIMYDQFKQKTHFVAHPGRFGHRLTDTVFIDYAGCIPTDIPNGEFFSRVRMTLKNNRIVGIFPEGHYTYDGNIKSFKIGVGRIALESSVPILPIAIQGTYDVCPGPKLIPKFKKIIKVVIGKPINPNNIGKERNLETYRKIASEVETEVKKLFKT